MPKMDNEGKFRLRGFSDRETPENDEPKLPTHISRVKNIDLGNLMSQYGAWREYAEHQLTTATAEAARAREKYDFEYDKAYQRCGSGTETSKKRLLGSDQELREERLKLLEAEIYRDMLASRVESYNNVLTIISREITRRGFTFEQNTK